MSPVDHYQRGIDATKVYNRVYIEYKLPVMQLPMPSVPVLNNS